MVANLMTGGAINKFHPYLRVVSGNNLFNHKRSAVRKIHCSMGIFANHQELTTATGPRMCAIPFWYACLISLNIAILSYWSFNSKRWGLRMGRVNSFCSTWRFKHLRWIVRVLEQLELSMAAVRQAMGKYTPELLGSTESLESTIHGWL